MLYKYGKCISPVLFKSLKSNTMENMENTDSNINASGNKNVSAEEKYVPTTTILNRNIRQLQMRRFSEHFQIPSKTDELDDEECGLSWSCFRENVSKMVDSMVFSVLFIVFNVLFVVTCILWDPEMDKNLSDAVETVEFVCHVIFAVFWVLRLMEWESQKIAWLLMDFTLVGLGIAGYALEDGQALRYVKALRTLRLIFLIKQIKLLNEPTTHLITALAKVGNILIPCILIIYVYAVVGLYSFSDLQYNKCRLSTVKTTSNNWSVYDPDDVFLCGTRTCPVTGTECLNPIDYDVQPDEEELVNMVQGNGLLQYNNILFAFVSTLKQTFGTGSSRLPVLYKQAMNPAFVLFYYYSYIYLISYIYLNIFYSLIITAEWDEQGNDAGEQIKNDYQIEQQKKKQSIEDGKKSPIEEEKKSKPGTLKLQKTKIHNIFEQVEETPNLQHVINLSQTMSFPDMYPRLFCFYNIVTNIIIVLSCVNLSLEYHGQTYQYQYVVDTIDFAFYCVLVVEIIVKVIIYGVKMGGLELGGKIDVAICVLATGGIIYEAVEASSWEEFVMATTVVAKVFRSFKYLRIFVIILDTPFFYQSKRILLATFYSVYRITNVICLWVLIVLLISIMGFHLHSYKTKVDSNGNLDLVNGQGFQVSMDGVFNSIIFTTLTFFNEEWDYLTFQQYLGSGALIVIWQLISLVVGLVLFSKYFMAILMKQLQELIGESEEGNEQLQNQLREQSQEDAKERLERQRKSGMTNRIEPEEYSQIHKSPRPTKQVSFNIDGNDSPQPFKVENSILKNKSAVVQQNSSAPATQQQEVDERTLCLRRILNSIKRAMQHRVYSIFRVCIILISCIVLINTHPQIDRTAISAKPYIILDTICITFFILELILSLLVYGLCQDANSYLRKSWMNWLNIVIIVIQILSFTELSEETVFLKIQRLKAFRVLFFVELRYRNDWSMRMTFHAFVQLLPKVASLLAITLIMYAYFALILVKVYKDDFYSCTNYYSSISIDNKNQCLLWGGDWIQQSINTANLFNSLLMLFLVATTEGWISLMTPMMNFRGEDLEPSYNSNQYINIFFVVFFFFGNLIMLNVFIGLSVSIFKVLKEKTTGESKLSKKERMWLSVKEQIYRLQPLIYDQEPENILRRYAYKLEKSTCYKVVKGIFFVGFLVTMSMFKSNMSQDERIITKYIQYGYVGILFFEQVIEYMAFGVRKDYIRSMLFKSFVLVYCIIYVIVNEVVSLNKQEYRILGAVFLILQFSRYLLLLNEITFARKLMNAIATILPRTSNILLLIAITLFIYTIIGMELFSYLRPSVELDAFNQNYTDFGSALFALIKFSTMENPIQQIIDGAQTSQPNFICFEIFTLDEFQEYGQKGCGNQVESYIFFLSFHIFYSLLLMSMFLAVIVDGYSEVKREENAFITKFVLEKVRKQWSKIDPEASGYIPYRQFWMFTGKLLQIYMGQELEKQKSDISKLFSSKEQLLAKMAIPIYQNENGILCFQFHEVIQALTRIYIQNTIKQEIKSKKTEMMFKERQSNIANAFKKSFYTSSHVSTLIILKSGLRWWKQLATNDNAPVEYKLIMQKFQQVAKQEESSRENSKKVLEKGKTIEEVDDQDESRE